MNTTSGRIRLCVLCFAALGTLARRGAAFNYQDCQGQPIERWTAAVTLRANPNSFPADSLWLAALETAAQRFNLNPANMTIHVEPDNDWVGTSNSENEVIFTDSDLLDSKPARAFTVKHCFWLFGWIANVSETDILIRADSSYWAASDLKVALYDYGGARRPLVNAILHEMGHGLVLNHVNTEYNVMGSDSTHIQVNGPFARGYFGEDASNGAVFLYGRRGAWSDNRDVGVSHWRYDTTWGEYSGHRRTDIRDAAGGALPSIERNRETVFQVRPGQQVDVEFSFENNGTGSETDGPETGVQVGFYVSTNDLITTLDRRIAGRTLSLGRDDVATYRTPLTVPADLDPGRDYWIGVIIDEMDAIREVVEWNNATYLPVQTLP